MDLMPTVQGIDYVRKKFGAGCAHSAVWRCSTGRRERGLSVSHWASSASCRRGIFPLGCASCPWRVQLPPAIAPWSSRPSLRREPPR